jgi:uncharacterized protein
MRNLSNILGNYLELRLKVDELCRFVDSNFGEAIRCRKGCDSCCRHISIFPVEAYAIRTALKDSHLKRSEQIKRLAQDANEERCPLLHQGVCLLYEARPIICRTHGYPLLTELDGKKTLDHCPFNFDGITNFPAKTIINMDLVNITLATINSVFCTSDSISLSIGKERLTIARALLLEL